MKSLDIYYVQDKDDPPYTSLGCGYILGTWWEAQIFLVGHRELVCKAKERFLSRKTLKDKSYSKVWFCCVGFAGIPPEGAGWDLCVTGRDWRLLGTAGKAALDLPWGCQGQSCHPLSCQAAPAPCHPRDTWNQPWKKLIFFCSLETELGLEVTAPSMPQIPLPVASSWCHCSVTPHLLEGPSSHPQRAGWCSHQGQRRIKCVFQMEN